METENKIEKSRNIFARERRSYERNVIRIQRVNRGESRKEKQGVSQRRGNPMVKRVDIEIAGRRRPWWSQGQSSCCIYKGI